MASVVQYSRATHSFARHRAKAAVRKGIYAVKAAISFAFYLGVSRATSANQAPTEHSIAAKKDPFEQLRRTLNLFALYRDEARKCKESGAALAGCVLLGSALEAALLAMTQCFPDDVQRVVALHKSKELARPAREWSLSQLLLLAHELSWLPTSGSPQDQLNPETAQIGDYAEVIRAMRNLLHPSIYLRECPDKAISDRHLQFSFDVLDEACSRLAMTLTTAKDRG